VSRLKRSTLSFDDISNVGIKNTFLISVTSADEVITRNCLSQVEYSRHDVPADKYEGCRPAAKDIQLAHYVNNSIKQLDVKRYGIDVFNDYYQYHFIYTLHKLS
jgi:hypothetical protein